jgi:hypothetical protein
MLLLPVVLALLIFKQVVEVLVVSEKEKMARLVHHILPHL